MNKTYSKLFIAIFISFLFLSVNAQHKGEIRSFSVIIDGDTLYGYRVGNDTIIEPRYSWAEKFHDGLAVVRDVKTGKYGYINMENEIVIPFLYDEAVAFGEQRLGGKGFNNLALVNIGIPEAQHFSYDGKWGLINKKGEEVLPIKYEDILGISDGAAFIFEGDIIRHDIGNDFYIEERGKYGLIDINGKMIVPPIYDEVIFLNGATLVKNDGKVFEINRKGEVIRTIVE